MVIYMEAKELLRKIGVINEIKEIITFEMLYENAVEKSYKIVTELGEISFRIIQLTDAKVSQLDYFNTAYRFNRNVNLMHPFN